MKEKTGFGLIGYPLGHSFSAAYFRHKFQQEGLEGYFYHNIETSDLPAEMKRLRTDGRYRGFNVTIPYKERVIPFLDALSAQAAAIGAVNTIRVEEDGRLTGHNTDCIGFFHSLQPLLSTMPGTFQTLVLGNGGASQAVQYALYSHGLPYCLVHRKALSAARKKAFKPLAEFSYETLPENVVAESLLVVNTTSLGMFPLTESHPLIPYQAMGRFHKAFDLVYNPEQTRFMQLCRGQGAEVRNGLEMLHLQAEAAWKIWQGEATGL